ncbi:MAG: efflux RND transporter periplasmic adaptor subunit [Eubacteriales bacterium]|nr:efflux RND transporter periplasmic adaptor subunit [Eubacteriales bacterium]
MEAEAKKSNKSKILIVIAVIAVIAVAALAVYRILGKTKDIETKSLSTVSVGHPETGDISIDTSLIGTVSPGDVYYVVPKVSGEITDIFVSVGDEVEEGQDICTIDNQKAIDAAKISLDSAAVSLKNAQESAQLAKTNLDRMTALLATGDISRQSYESTKNSYDQASAGVQAAQLQLEGAQLQYDTQVEFATVTAPTAGTVESVNMSVNGLVSSASQVCVISSSGDNKIKFNVTDRLLDAFKTGNEITVTKQGSEYKAKVTSVSTLPSASTGLYPIEAAFVGDNAIPNGASVKLNFISEKAEGVMLMDTDDISYDGGKTYVYTISYDTEGLNDEATIIDENNKLGTVHKNEVETGLSNNEKTEIVSGITSDSLVIKSWTAQLYEGAKVQVLPEG